MKKEPKSEAEKIDNQQGGGALADVGRIISFNTYGENNRLIKGKIIKSLFDNELQLKYYIIEPLEDFDGYKTISRTEGEVFNIESNVFKVGNSLLSL